MYIDFGEYSPYSGSISESVETNVNAHIRCDHGYPYSSIKYNIMQLINDESW